MAAGSDAALLQRRDGFGLTPHGAPWHVRPSGARLGGRIAVESMAASLIGGADALAGARRRAAPATRARMSPASSSGGARRVEHEEPIRLGGGEREELRAHPRRGSRPARPPAGRTACRPHPGAARAASDRGRAARSRSGRRPLGRPERQVAHLRAAEHASGALVGDGRVEVAILDHDRRRARGRAARRSRRGAPDRPRRAAPRPEVRFHPGGAARCRGSARRPRCRRARACARRWRPAPRSHSSSSAAWVGLADAVAALERDEETAGRSLLRRRLARCRRASRGGALGRRALGALVGDQLHGTLEVDLLASSPRGMVAFVSPSVT